MDLYVEVHGDAITPHSAEQPIFCGDAIELYVDADARNDDAGSYDPTGTMQFVIQLIMLGIFAGLVAYDTQKLKLTYYQVKGDAGGMAAATNFSALNLYLDFINIFQLLLSLFGCRR